MQSSVRLNRQAVSVIFHLRLNLLYFYSQGAARRLREEPDAHFDEKSRREQY
jgi:hypothetical protein